jgi:hypothetical protein
MNTYLRSLSPKELQDLLDELEPSRASRKRARAILQEIRWVLKDVAGIEISPPARKTIDLEGRLVKDGVRKALEDQPNVLNELTHAIRGYRKFCEHGDSRLPDANVTNFEARGRWARASDQRRRRSACTRLSVDAGRTTTAPAERQADDLC